MRMRNRRCRQFDDRHDRRCSKTENRTDCAGFMAGRSVTIACGAWLHLRLRSHNGRRSPKLVKMNVPERDDELNGQRKQRSQGTEAAMMSDPVHVSLGRQTIYPAAFAVNRAFGPSCRAWVVAVRKAAVPASYQMSFEYIFKGVPVARWVPQRLHRPPTNTASTADDRHVCFVRLKRA